MSKAKAKPKKTKRKKMVKAESCWTKKKNLKGYQKAPSCADFALQCLTSLQY
jgi:hypothetical protein